MVGTRLQLPDYVYEPIGILLKNYFSLSGTESVTIIGVIKAARFRRTNRSRPYKREREKKKKTEGLTLEFENKQSRLAPPLALVFKLIKGLRCCSEAEWVDGVRGWRRGGEKD